MNQSKKVDELEDDEDDVEGAAIDDADEVEGKSRLVIKDLEDQKGGATHRKPRVPISRTGRAIRGLFSMRSRRTKAMPGELQSMISRTSRTIAERAAIERQAKRRRTIKKGREKKF